HALRRPRIAGRAIHSPPRIEPAHRRLGPRCRHRIQLLPRRHATGAGSLGTVSRPLRSDRGSLGVRRPPGARRGDRSRLVGGSTARRTFTAVTVKKCDDKISIGYRDGASNRTRGRRPKAPALVGQVSSTAILRAVDYLSSTAPRPMLSCLRPLPNGGGRQRRPAVTVDCVVTSVATDGAPPLPPRKSPGTPRGRATPLAGPTRNRPPPAAGSLRAINNPPPA